MGPSLRGREVSLIKGAGNRLLLKKLEKEVYKDMEQVTARLNQLSKRIRTGHPYEQSPQSPGCH